MEARSYGFLFSALFDNVMSCGDKCPVWIFKQFARPSAFRRCWKSLVSSLSSNRGTRCAGRARFMVPRRQTAAPFRSICRGTPFSASNAVRKEINSICKSPSRAYPFTRPPGSFASKPESMCSRFDCRQSTASSLHNRNQRRGTRKPWSELRVPILFSA